MAQTVTQCLTAAEDSATVINDINTNGNKSTHAGGGTDAEGNAVAGTWSQAQINERVQQNVDHLETILAYDGSDGKQYALQYEKFVPILVKAVQELSPFYELADMYALPVVIASLQVVFLLEDEPTILGLSSVPS